MSYNPLISFNLDKNQCLYKFENKIIYNKFINFVENNDNNTLRSNIKIDDNKIIINNKKNMCFEILKKWKETYKFNNE